MGLSRARSQERQAGHTVSGADPDRRLAVALVLALGAHLVLELVQVAAALLLHVVGAHVAQVDEVGGLADHRAVDPPPLLQHTQGQRSDMSPRRSQVRHGTRRVRRYITGRPTYVAPTA